MDSQLAAEIRKMRSDMRSLTDNLNNHYKPALALAQREIASLQRTNSAASPTGGGLLQSIEAIPGARMPQWYVIEKDINDGAAVPAGGVTAQTFGSVEVSPEGPFIVTQVAGFWRITSSLTGEMTGRLVPMSGFRTFAQGADGTVTLATVNTNIVEIPEFAIRFEVDGSGRFWCNEFMPAHMIDALDHPTYTGCLGWVDGSNRLKCHIDPIIATPNAGTAIIVYVGYQILNPVRLGEVLAGKYAA